MFTDVAPIHPTPANDQDGEVVMHQKKPSPASPFLQKSSRIITDEEKDLLGQGHTYPKGEQPGLSVMFSMFKYVVGTGILSHPLAMHDVGLVGYFLVATFFCSMSIWGNYLLGRALDIAGRTDLNIAELGDRACGRFGFFLACFMCWADSWGGIIAYLKALASTIQPVLQDPSVFGDRWWTRESVLIVLFSIVVYPFCLWRKMEQLSIVLMLGSIGIASFVVGVVANATLHAQSLESAPLFKTDINAAVALPVIAFSFDCQVNLFANYRELNSQTGAKAARLGRWTAASLVGAFVCSSAVALAGYSVYLNCLDAGGNLLDNFSIHWWPLKLLVFVSVIPDIPLNCFEGTRILQDHIFGTSPTSNVLVTFGLLSSAAFVAILLPSVYAAFGYVGAVSSTTLTSVLPPLFFLGITRRAYGGAGELYSDALADERDTDAAPLAAKPPKWMLVLAAITMTIDACVVPAGVALTAMQQSSSDGSSGSGC
eukprot:Hpha_TRINITY_DN15751_c2_g3::TRINITY_DN15751_c2_g3_i2::g.40846::m.40846